MNSSSRLATSGVSFTYPDGTRALKDVDFIVQDREFVALLASNGSGKTTLIKVLVGLLKAQHGSVHVCGTNIRKLKSRELYQKVGLVLQNPQDQLFATTVEEDVAFGVRNLNLDETEVQSRVEQALESVGA